MRIAFGLVKHHHAAAVVILLIVAALVVGAAACDGARTYQLTISSASGGNVTSPGEGTFPYPQAPWCNWWRRPTMVTSFARGPGTSQHIADPNAASTTITMNGNYAIVANFQTEGGTGPGGGGHTQP